MNASIAVPAPPRAGDEQRSALVIVALAILAFLVALAVRSAAEGSVAPASVLDGRVSLAYPAAWITGAAGDGVLLSVADPRSPTAFSASIVVRSRKLAQGQGLNDAAAAWLFSQSRALAQFTDLGSSATTLDGRPAIRASYAYVAPAATGAGLATLPIVVRSTDTLTLVGDQVIIVSTASDAGQSARYTSYFARALSSIKLRN